MKFVNLVQNSTQITAVLSKLQREENSNMVTFFQNGSNSAVDYGTSTKFVFRIDCDLLIRVTSSNTKPDVV